MDRRSLLTRSTALMLLPWAAGHLSARAASTAKGPLRRRRPTDPDWPDASQWGRLHDAVGGRLVAVQPLMAPCAPSPVAAACLALTGNLRNPFFLGDQVAGTQVSGWLDAWTPAASAYAVQATSTADVVAAVDFAREHQLRLVVKGAGHSYQGTSNAPDSLLVWTRAMNEVTLHEAFVPAGCEGRVKPVPAVSAGSGAVWIDLYDAVTVQKGRYVQGGGCTDVGVAGLVQSGGFGSFSKAFGTAAASLLEAEIVTAAGQVRIVNACADPDLFWALKGGGGGSWGVVTRVTLRTHDLPRAFGAVWGKIQANSEDAWRRLVARFVDFYAEHLLNPHWGEQVGLAPERTLKISMVCQGLDSKETAGAWAPLLEWVQASPDDYAFAEPFGSWAGDPRRWWALEGNPAMIRDPREGAPRHHGWWRGDQAQVGAWLHGYDSVWLPAALLAPGDRRRLADALVEAASHKDVGLHFNKGLGGAAPEAVASARDTATNPAVCDAFALAIIADAGAPAYPGLGRTPPDLAAAHASARAIDLAAGALRRVAPGAGSYVSESNYFNADWKQAFFGRNIGRLQAVKDRVDPDGLFFVHHGVGSDSWSADGFTRL